MTHPARILPYQDSVAGGMGREEVTHVVTAEVDSWKQQFKHMLDGPYAKVRSDRRKIYCIGGFSFLLSIALVTASIYYWSTSSDGSSTFSEHKDATDSMLAVFPLEDLLDYRTALLPISPVDKHVFEIVSITRIGQASEQITIAELSDQHTLTIKDGGVCTLFSEASIPVYQWTISLSGDETNSPLASLSSTQTLAADRRLAAHRAPKSIYDHKHRNPLRTYLDHLPQAMGAAMYPYGVNPFNVPGYDYGPNIGENPGPPVGPHPFTVNLLRAGWPGQPVSPRGRTNVRAPDRVGLSYGMGGDGRSPGRGWNPSNNFDVIPTGGS
eukprot:GHVS01006631.1.p1 GENE.GHVS01006631.1~~GHVS01006631.1.p1  ORF type:complete len:325 (+),score=32.55 GHVS01006631.1:157-1131(+)